MTFATMPIISAACLGIAMLAVVAEAGGSSSARLVYARAPEASSCPDEAALRDAVAARMGYDPFYPLARQTVLMQIWRERHGYRARLQLLDPENFTYGTRDLASNQPTCAELFDAAALAISIAMDSLPKHEPQPASAPTPPPTPEPPLAPAPAPPPTLAPEPLPARLPAPVPAPKPGTRFTLGVDALGALNAEPGPTAALAAFGGLRWRAASTCVEVRADAPGATASATGPGRVRAWSYQALLVTCLLYSGASLCAVGAAGLLYGESTGITNPASDSGGILLAGARLGYDWPLSDRFYLRTHLDAMFDLNRPRLEIGGGDAWTAPLVAGSGGVGIAANFE